MAILPLRLYPDEILRQETAEVTEFSEELGTLLDNMAETMYEERGIGLAGPQIGEALRITVIDVSDEGDSVQEFINPRIVARNGETPSEEGCLSIPEYRETITRAEEVTVEAQDRNGESFTVEADGLFAICLQHEIDHLDGVLFIDHLSKIKRDLFKKKYKKILQNLEA